MTLTQCVPNPVKNSSKALRGTHVVLLIAFYDEKMLTNVALVISALLLDKIFCYLTSVSLLLIFVSLSGLFCLCTFIFPIP